MGICGSQTLKGQRPAIKATCPHLQYHKSFQRWIVSKMVWVILLFFPFLVGCAPTLKYGSPPKVNQLGMLKPCMSNKSNVLAALGEPRGHGAARLSSVAAPREIWFYEYSESHGSRMDLKFLLVFFDKDLYDGHLWFSSSLLLDTGE